MLRRSSRFFPAGQGSPGKSGIRKPRQRRILRSCSQDGAEHKTQARSRQFFPPLTGLNLAPSPLPFQALRWGLSGDTAGVTPRIKTKRPAIVPIARIDPQPADAFD